MLNSKLNRRARRSLERSHNGGNNRSNKLGGRNNGQYVQIIYSEAPMILVGTYLTKKGQRLMKLAKNKAEKDEIKRRYEKNRYKANPKAIPVKRIYHQIA